MALAGELDLATAERFDWALARVTATARVDLGGVTFVDHGTLVALDRWAAQSGQDLVLTNASSAVDRVVGILGLPHLHLEAAT